MNNQRLKRVNWASDDNLCQVKLFLSEDCPSQVGSKAQDHLKKKESLHSNGIGVDDLPPGFGGNGDSYTPNQICIPQIRWKRPPKFMLDSEWHVVAGEESEEKGTQNYREMRVLEALYPRASAIPPSPSILPEVEICVFDDNQTPIIPLTPVEDEDGMPMESTSCSNSGVLNQSMEASSAVPCNVPVESKAAANGKLQGLAAGFDADIFAAASAAITASMKSNEKGSMVDTDLLIKILNEPKMIEALLSVSGSSSTKPVTPIHEPKHEAVSVPLSLTDRHLSISQKPMVENSNMHKMYQPKQGPAAFTSQPFHGPTTSWPSSEPSRHSTVTSSQRGNENLKPFTANLRLHSDTESPNQSLPLSSLDHHTALSMFGDRRFTPNASSSLGSNMAVPSTLCGPIQHRSNAEKTAANGLEPSRSIVPPLSSPNMGSNASPSDLFSRPDRISLQNTRNSDLQSSQPSLGTSRNFSPKPEDLYAGHRPNGVSSHMPMGSSQYSAPQPDRFPVPPQSSIRNPAVKNVNYYKSLIRLHGAREDETQEQFTPMYQASLPELTAVSAVSGQGHTRKIPKPCKFYNSAKGCRYGSTCPFEHGSMLDLRAGNFPENDRSKRLKISSDSKDKC